MKLLVTLLAVLCITQGLFAEESSTAQLAPAAEHPQVTPPQPEHPQGEELMQAQPEIESPKATDLETTDLEATGNVYTDFRIDMRKGLPRTLVQDPSGITIEIVDMMHAWGEDPLKEEYFEEMYYEITLSLGDMSETHSFETISTSGGTSGSGAESTKQVYPIGNYVVTIYTRNLDIDIITIR